MSHQYSVYSYKGNAEICIDGEIISLQQALDADKVTMEEILNITVWMVIRLFILEMQKWI